MPMLETVIVRLNAAVFVLYGVAFVAFPEALSQWVTGTVPASASGLIDMRATYGGMSLALGGLLYVLATAPATVRLGLVGVLLAMLSMAAGRLCGIVLDGDANPVMFIYLALELGMAAVAGGCLVRADGRH